MGKRNPPRQTGSEGSERVGRRESESAERRERRMEDLLAAVENGDIEAIEDLTEREVELLLSRSMPGESFEDLLDRLRRPAREPE
jgi:hypothetical protein